MKMLHHCACVFNTICTIFPPSPRRCHPCLLHLLLLPLLFLLLLLLLIKHSRSLLTRERCLPQFVPQRGVQRMIWTRGRASGRSSSWQRKREKEEGCWRISRKSRDTNTQLRRRGTKCRPRGCVGVAVEAKRRRGAREGLPLALMYNTCILYNSKKASNKSNSKASIAPMWRCAWRSVCVCVCVEWCVCVCVSRVECVCVGQAD